MAGHRLAHRSDAQRAELRAGADHQIAFGLAVEFVDGQAEGRLAPFQRLDAERLAARGHAAQLEIVAAARIRRRAHHAQRGRRNEGVAHADVLHQREGFFRIELVELARDHRHAVMQARQQRIEQTAGPGPVGRRPVAVAGLRKRIMRQFGARHMAEQNAMGMQRAFRLAGRARGVNHHRRIVGRGIDRRESRRRARELIVQTQRRRRPRRRPTARMSDPALRRGFRRAWRRRPHWSAAPWRRNSASDRTARPGPNSTAIGSATAPSL